MNAKLILLADDGRSGEYKLKLPVIMGRSRQAGLTVLHSSVSRQHCEFTEYEGQLVVNDLGSLNGTFIEETRIGEPTILPDGGLLRVGSVRFQASYGTADLAPPKVQATGLLPPGVEGADPMRPAGTVEILPGSPETEPLQPMSAGGEEELELMFEEDAGAATPAGPAPASAARRAGAPAPAPQKPAPTKSAPAKPAAPQKPATPDEQTLSFLPDVPDSAPPGEATSEDLDSFFKSLQ